MTQHEFQVGELAWHTGMRVLVKIAGPLEMLSQWRDMQGNVVTEPINAYRIVARDGKAWLTRPHTLRRVRPFFVSTWPEFQRSVGWLPSGVRL